MNWLSSITFWLRILVPILLVAFNFLFAAWAARSARQLYVQTHSAERALYRLRVVNRYILGILLLTTVIVASLAMLPELKSLGKVGGFIAVLIPFVLCFVLAAGAQSIQYNVIRTIRGTTQSRKEQLATGARWLALILVPLLIWNLGMVALPAQVVDHLFDSHVWGLVIPLLFVVAVNLASPLFLRRTLQASPMPPSELRDTLEDFVRSSGIGDVQLFTWPARKGRLANALVSGYVKKRVYISDYLLDHFTVDEIKGILAHEIGHIKRHHLWIRLLFVIGWVPLVELAAYLGNTYASDAPDWVPIPVMLVLFLGYFGLFFQFTSRIQERQADAYVLRLGVQPVTFISALLKLAKLNHMVTRPNKLDERFHTHPSIARRIRWVAELGNVSHDEIQRVQEALQ